LAIRGNHASFGHRLTTVEASIACPYCGEENVILVDESAGESQEYVEDCQVCCQPWQVRVTLDEQGEPDIEVRKAGE